MDTFDALAARRSCRSFANVPIQVDVLDRVLAASLRAPSAGNAWALQLVVLDTSELTARYWDTTLAVGPARDRFPWPGLLAAPVLVIPSVDASAYPERYAGADKARTGLGDGLDAWPVPYWWVDAGAAVMAVLTAAASVGLGSLLFGQFGHEPDVTRAFGLDAQRRSVGTIALGWPSDEPTRRSGSARRGRPALADIVIRPEL